MLYVNIINKLEADILKNSSNFVVASLGLIKILHGLASFWVD